MGLTAFTDQDITLEGEWYCTRTPEVVTTLRAVNTIEEELYKLFLRRLKLPRP